MSATETDLAPPGEEEHDEALHEHPSDLKYIWIALILGVLTALEVGTYFVEDTVDQTILTFSLLIMMVCKFAIVALYFMHLKFDGKLFTRVFVAGIVLAVAVYVATLLTFTFWSV